MVINLILMLIILCKPTCCVRARECPCEPTVVTGGGSSQTCCIYLPDYLSINGLIFLMYVVLLSLALTFFLLPLKVICCVCSLEKIKS